METPREGYPFFIHTKKETEQSKISLSRNSPVALDAPFARFAPAALKSFRHPGGGYPFLTETPREGVPKFYEDSEGGDAFFMGTFPESTPPPRNSEQSLIFQQSIKTSFQLF